MMVVSYYIFYDSAKFTRSIKKTWFRMQSLEM